MSDQEVAQLRFELENIKTRGKDVPKPVKSWNQTGLPRRVLDILKALKYDTPTPIQAQALPVTLSGRDMLGIAKTGSGKTLAFLLPVLRHVLDQRRVQQGEVCVCVCVCVQCVCVCVCSVYVYLYARVCFALSLDLPPPLSLSLSLWVEMAPHSKCSKQPSS